ncbi:hypothetical protein [Actinomadura verrucosospora]|uniref:Uncharacterized protein n=1 Tax=Actinomadura verrucosospora TaxID=46165 RepID=A0A7D3ZVW3_ACTVE|nr:hypothetical protein [Actinomadura verrucosospora]QKG20326.1 hypothetical protein ACTIVE_1964 [Actinomadura verrucosospora]
MAFDLKDLTEVMEAETERGVPSPDLLAGVRRRVRRSNRLRAAAAAFGVVLMAGTAFGVVQGQGGSGPHQRDVLAPTMSGVTNDAFLKSRSVEGLKPLKEVRFTEFGRMARVTFTPTGPFTMYTVQCSRDAMWYDAKGEGLAITGCGGTAYMFTKPGVSQTVETTALPVSVAQELGDGPSSRGALDRFLAAHAPIPGAWSLRVYSGPCTNGCKEMRDPSTFSPPAQPPLSGLKQLGSAFGTADGRSRTVRLKEPGKALRLRVTCLDGAATAVVRIGGRAKVVDCERAESHGVVWDQDAGAGTSAIGITVLPAEAGEVHATDDAALAKQMRGAKPAGRWTLDVYAR